MKLGCLASPLVAVKLRNCPELNSLIDNNTQFDEVHSMALRRNHDLAFSVFTVAERPHAIASDFSPRS